MAASVYLALFSLNGASAHDLRRLEAFATKHGLTLGRQWGQARYYLASVEQVVSFAESTVWMSLPEVERELHRGQLGYQTSLTLGGLDQVANIGIIAYRGGHFLALEMSDDVICSLAERLQRSHTSIESFLAELAAAVRARSFAVGWEVALDTLADMLLGYLHAERVRELAEGCELRLISAPGTVAERIFLERPSVSRLEANGRPCAVAWLPGTLVPSQC